ncbi:MAG: YihY/virulence factor BrkB family protein [Pirellula sp.]|jgi:membrane protein|nr:YihY/virulence factor BrkB family protein [Pirellula sp.]
MSGILPEEPVHTAKKVQAAVAQRGRRWVMDFFPNLRDAGIRWTEDDASSMAASVAYYLALSLFPMMLLLTSGIGIFLRFTNTGKDAEQQILTTVETYASEEVKMHIEQVLGHLRDHSLVSGPFGMAAAILAAIGVFAQIDRGFDRIFRIPVQKSTTVSRTLVRVLRHRFLAFVMLVSLGGLIVVLFTASMLIAQLRSITGQTLPVMAHAFSGVELGFAVAANALLFTLVYRVLPKREVRWLDALRGGLLAALIWELGREVLGVFLIGMRYTSAYGAIGSFIAILLWCYYAISILFFGAEYVQAIENRRQERAHPPAKDATLSQDVPSPELELAIAEADHPEFVERYKPRRSLVDT